MQHTAPSHSHSDLHHAHSDSSGFALDHQGAVQGQAPGQVPSMTATAPPNLEPMPHSHKIMPRDAGYAASVDSSYSRGQPPGTERSQHSTDSHMMGMGAGSGVGANTRHRGDTADSTHSGNRGTARASGSRGGRGKPSKAQLAKEKKAAEKAKKIAAVPSQVPHTVKSSNSINWSAFEAAELQKLSDTVLAMEKNKWRTGEAPLNKHGGGVFGATEEVRALIVHS